MYIENNLLFILGIPLWIFTRIIINIVRYKKEKSVLIKRELLLSVFYIYILSVLGVTFFPLCIFWDDIDSSFVSVNVLPVYSTVKDVIYSCSNSSIPSFMIRFWLKNILGNLILLFPLGILLPLLWDKFRKVRRVTVFSLFVSLSIEVLQLVSIFIGNRGRAFDIDDIILNTIGAFLGVLLINRVIHILKDRKYKPVT
jgi:glycopeptide antibiotics resistance protein